jgi:2-polyprenyl-6-methoxyphenol hydroxylase-like FAD-dependent oxidoreductase
MKQVRRVLVVGGGVGGLAAAADLSRRGVEVVVAEKRSANQALGVGINQPANSLRVLRSLGVLDEILAQGFVYDKLQFFDRDGNHIVDAPSSLGGDVPANCALSRLALSEALYRCADRAGARIVHDLEVTELNDSGDSVRAVGAGADLGEFDLALAFDGMASATRKQLFGDRIAPAFTGHAVWRVTAPRPGSVTCCQLFHGIDTKAGLIPISDAEMYLFLVSSEPGNPRHDPARFHELLKSRLMEFTGVVADIREGIGPGSDIVYSPLSEALVDGDWHKGRVVVAGDAAHLAAPHLTQGAAMALEDAALLVELLDRDIPVDDSLREFAQRRVPRIKLVQKVSGEILRAEMSVTTETYRQSLEDLRSIPAKLAAVEVVLNGAY